MFLASANTNSREVKKDICKPLVTDVLKGFNEAGYQKMFDDIGVKVNFISLGSSYECLSPRKVNITMTVDISIQRPGDVVCACLSGENTVIVEDTGKKIVTTEIKKFNPTAVPCECTTKPKKKK
jgi:hypothetical protein